jgi:hypothetical protein
VDASERLSANQRRKAASTDLPVQKKLRVNDTELLEQFIDLKSELEDRTGKYSVQATLEYALRLAHQQLEEARAQDDKLSDVANNI